MSGWPSRARRAIRRMRPHAPHSRCGRSAQRAQTARPAASRPATGLTIWQRAHASASCLRRQLAHTPPAPERVSGLSRRPQRTQAGSGSAEPAARNAVTSRPTTGGAPPDSAVGSAASAAHRSRLTAGWVLTASTAAATVTAGSDGSAAAAASMIRCRRHGGHGRPRPAPPRG